MCSCFVVYLYSCIVFVILWEKVFMFVHRNECNKILNFIRVFITLYLIYKVYKAHLTNILCTDFIAGSWTASVKSVWLCGLSGPADSSNYSSNVKWRTPYPKSDEWLPPRAHSLRSCWTRPSGRRHRRCFFRIQVRRHSRYVFYLPHM